jgi:hypothetical protein
MYALHAHERTHERALTLVIADHAQQIGALERDADSPRTRA